MFNGKEKRRELINELRSTHALQNAQIAIKKHEKNTLQQKQRQEKLFKQQVSKMSVIFHSWGVTGSLLDQSNECICDDDVD